MTFFNCVADAVDEGSVKADIGRKVQEAWREISDAYERQGYGRHQAEVLAGTDVKAIWKRKAANERHILQSRIQFMRDAQIRVAEAKPEDLKRIGTQALESVDYEARGLRRMFNMRLSEMLAQIHPNLIGSLKNEKMMTNVTTELFGEASGSEGARAIAKAVQDTFEEARVMFNSAGGLIGKRDRYDIPHSHDRLKITQAGRETWVNDMIDNERLDWSQITNKATETPFQSPDGPPPPRDMQVRFLSEVYRNIQYGKESRKAVYGQPNGTALYKQGSDARVLHFKNAEAWIEYNKAYGTGDPFNSIIQHLSNMSDDIALMRRLGGNPSMGLDYIHQLSAKRAGDEGLDIDDVQARNNEQQRMLRVFRGPNAPSGKWGAYSASFFSKTRHLMTSAFLDRAIIASISDMNTMRLAAQEFGSSPSNMFKTYGQNLSEMIKNGSMTTQQLKRDRWVMDSLADPVSVMDRFQMEVPPGEFFERMVSASMKIQGLSQHTDNARYAFQSSTWGVYADNADKGFEQIDPNLRKMMEDHGVTPQIWDDFRSEGLAYEPEDGVTFLNPLYWRESTKMDPQRADDVFIAMQGLSERWTEIAVPTSSLRARAYVDPVAWGMPPGGAVYEGMKSAGMFKSFVMAFTMNQYRMIQRQPTNGARAAYVANLVGGATVLGALSLQITEVLKGNDPMNMSIMENPDFWSRALLKGGGFGPIGDIVATGESSWGGGFASYAAGPMFQAADDVWDLGPGNAIDAVGDMMRGEEIDTGFARELTRLGKRYTPMGQTPLVGPAIDRLIWDQLHLALDPDASEAIRRASTLRENRDGNDEWWLPGSPLPDRMPSLTGALGG